MRYLLILFFISFLVLPAIASDVQVEINLNHKNSFKGQTNAGTFFTAAIKDYFKADVAFLCSTSIKNGTGKGAYDSSFFSTLLYYPDDSIVTLELTGRQVRQIMERCIGLYPVENSNFLQVSGLKGTFSSSGESGNKVVDLYIGGNPVQPDSVYRVALDDTLARGFAGYVTFTEVTDINNTGLSIKQVIEAYLEKHPVINNLENSGMKSL